MPRQAVWKEPLSLRSTAMTSGEMNMPTPKPACSACIQGATSSPQILTMPAIVGWQKPTPTPVTALVAMSWNAVLATTRPASPTADSSPPAAAR